MKIRFPFRIFFLSLYLVNLSCESKSSYDENSVFRYNENKNVTSLDPAFARNPQNIWPIQQLFNGLVQLDDSLIIQPEIAKHWQIDEKGTKYTFTLRSDVFFHPSPLFGKEKTRKVVASDFCYSFDRLKDKTTSSPGGWVLRNIKTYKAINDSILEIKLKKPFAAFLGLLTMRYCSVVPKEVVEHYKENFRNHPIGTGPFLFKRWEEDVKLVLRKNNYYFEKDSLGNKLPYLESIAISFLSDIQSEFMLFSQGKFDFLNSLDNSYKDELLTPSGTLQPKYVPTIKMLKGPYLNTEYIGFYLDSESKSIQSPLIKQAINIGFDRVKMISFLRNMIGFPALQGMIPKGLPGHHDKIINNYNPQKAKQLVEEFIKINKQSPVLHLATDANYVDICEYLQRELQKIGIEIKIDIMPTATLRQAKSSGKVEAFRASWIADYPDAENYLSLFYSENLSPYGPNYTHFSNAEFDTLYNNVLSLNNPKKRIAHYQKMDSIILSENPVIPLYYDQVTSFIQSNVHGMKINPINLLSLKKVSKK